MYGERASRGAGAAASSAAARSAAARAGRSLFQAAFAPGDFLVFGQEQLGLPPALLDALPGRCLSIPMLEGRRSLNLAVAVGVAVYHALASLSG